MNTKKKILSTKKLSEAQKELLNNFTLDEIELIEISFNTSIKLANPIKNAVFTSKNAVIGVFNPIYLIVFTKTFEGFVSFVSDF